MRRFTGTCQFYRRAAAVIEDQDEAGGESFEADNEADEADPFYGVVEVEVEILAYPKWSVSLCRECFSMERILRARSILLDGSREGRWVDCLSVCTFEAGALCQGVDLGDC